MPFSSQLELPGSPSEQGSRASITYYWNPTASGTHDLAPDETPSSPAAQVLQYDPAYPTDTKDVTSTVVAVGSPFVGSGTYANQIGVTIAGLTAGYEYRVLLWFQGDAGHVVERFFRVRCQL